MSHSPNGECDFEAQRTDETSGSEQLARGAHDTGPSCHSDGSKPTPHPAHTGGLPEARRCIPVPWPPGPQASQRYSRGDQEQGGSPGSHGVQRWGLPWSTTQAAMSAQQVAPCRASGELPTSSSQSTKTAETCSAIFHIDPRVLPGVPPPVRSIRSAYIPGSVLSRLLAIIGFTHPPGSVRNRRPWQPLYRECYCGPNLNYKQLRRNSPGCKGSMDRTTKNEYLRLYDLRMWRATVAVLLVAAVVASTACSPEAPASGE